MVFEKSRKTVIDVDDNVTLPYDSIIKCPIVKIGFGSRINGKINIRGEEKCTIGRYCAIGFDVRIITTNHKTNYPNLQVAFNRKYKSKFKGLYKGSTLSPISKNATRAGCELKTCKVIY